MKKLLNFESTLLVNSSKESVKISTPKIDENIVCYTSGLNYTEDILSYGLSVVRQGRQVNISTPAELLSKSAYDSGVRFSTNKHNFTDFLPAFINKAHAEKNGEWKSTLKNTLTQIGSEVYNIPESQLAHSVYEIFSRLINTLIF